MSSSEPIYIEPKTYEEALDAIYDFASSDPKDRRPAIRVNVNRTGLKEIARGDTPEERLGKIGYCIEDVSGDGIPELIIGEINNKSKNAGTRIISLYTTADGETCLAHEGRLKINGWARSRYYLLDDGLLYHEGSGGARYSFSSIEEISEDGTSVKKREVFATYIRENGKERFGNFHLIYDENGDYTVEEKNEDNESEWHSRSEDRSRTVNLDLIPMSEYK